VSILGRRISSWYAWGMTGLIVGASLFLILTIHDAQEPLIAVMLVALNCAAMLLIQRISERLFGYVRGVLLEHLVPLLLLNTLILGLGDIRIGAYLDRLIMGGSVFLMFGRIGCVSAGCCHGRPASWGMRYPWLIWKNAPIGLREVRLLPVQALESLLFAILFAGELLIYLHPHQSGTIVAFFLAGYGAGRFGFEFFRGDERPYFLRFSEAQWTCLGLILSLAIPWMAGVSNASQLWLLFCGSALLIVVGMVIMARSHLGPPLLRPLNKHDLDDFMATVRRARSIASEAFSGSGTNVSASGETYRGLYVEVSLAITPNEQTVEQYQFRGPRGPLNGAMLNFVTSLAHDSIGQGDGK
jgi:prolipoprotein diacylglyceryltransferase